MKKKAYVTIVLIFAFSLLISSTIFAADSFVKPTAESDVLFWDNVMSFYDEYMIYTFENPENPEDNIGSKNEESEINRRGHRIRIPAAEKTDKKFIELDN